MQSKEVSEYWARYEQEYEKKNYYEAFGHLKIFLENELEMPFPKVAAHLGGYWYKLGNTFYKEGNYEQAIVYYDEALLQFGNWTACIATITEKTDALLQINEVEKADTFLKKTLNCIDAENMHYIVELLASVMSLKKSGMDELFKVAAQNHFDNNQYEDAIYNYTQALKFDSSDDSLWYNKGKALLELNNVKDALICFENAISNNTHCALYWQKKGSSLMRLNQYEPAVNAFNEALRLDKNNDFTWFLKASSLQHQARYQEASRCYEAANNLNTGVFSYLFSAGQIHYYCDMYTTAIDYLDEAIRVNHNDVNMLAKTWAFKGLANVRLNITSLAKKCFRTALSLDPSCVEAKQGKLELVNNKKNRYLTKGKAFQAKKNYREAMIYWDRLLEMDPTQIDVWLDKGGAFYSLNEYDNALNCYERILAISQTNRAAHYNKGCVLLVKGDTGAALESFEQAHYHGHPEAIKQLRCDSHQQLSLALAKKWTNRALEFVEANENTEALLCIQKAINFSPDNEASWSLKATIMGNMDWTDQATEAANQSLKLRNNPVAWKIKARLLLKKNEDREALVCLEKAIRLDPLDLNNWKSKTEIHLKLKEYHFALSALNKWLAIDPKSDEALVTKRKVTRLLENRWQPLLNAQARPRVGQLDQRIKATEKTSLTRNQAARECCCIGFFSYLSKLVTSEKRYTVVNDKEHDYSYRGF